MGNGCLLLTQNQSLYAGRLSGFDCVCGTFRHDTTDDAFYETQPDVLFAEAIRAPLAEPRGRVVQGYARDELQDRESFSVSWKLAG